jgi:hypothetical protein
VDKVSGVGFQASTLPPADIVSGLINQVTAALEIPAFSRHPLEERVLPLSSRGACDEGSL